MQHDDEAWRWHARYGHIYFDSLHQLGRQDMVRGLPWLEHVEQLYDTYITMNHRRAPFQAKAKYCTDDVLDLVHSDLCSPITPATPSRRRYFLLLVDDASRFTLLVSLAAKSDAAAIKKFQAATEVQSR
jgi:hypothetical protein